MDFGWVFLLRNFQGVSFAGSETFSSTLEPVFKFPPFWIIFFPTKSTKQTIAAYWNANKTLTRGGKTNKHYSSFFFCCYIERERERERERRGEWLGVYREMEEEDELWSTSACQPFSLAMTNGGETLHSQESPSFLRFNSPPPPPRSPANFFSFLHLFAISGQVWIKSQRMMCRECVLWSVLYAVCTPQMAGHSSTARNGMGALGFCKCYIQGLILLLRWIGFEFIKRTKTRLEPRVTRTLSKSPSPFAKNSLHGRKNCAIVKKKERTNCFLFSLHFFSDHRFVWCGGRQKIPLKTNYTVPWWPSSNKQKLSVSHFLWKNPIILEMVKFKTWCCHRSSPT